MDGVIPAAGNKSAESKDLLQQVQSATQSQQFKTVQDNSKGQLNDGDSHDVSVKNKLQTSHSEDKQELTGEKKQEETKDRLDTKSKESESANPIANEVIEEQDEHDEEERKNAAILPPPTQPHH